MDQENKDKSNCWELYGVKIRVLPARLRRVARAIIESLGIEDTEPNQIPGPEILIRCDGFRRSRPVLVTNPDPAKQFFTINVPRMLGSFPCIIEFSRDNGFSKFEVVPDIHLRQNVISKTTFKMLTADYFDLMEHEISCLKYYVIRRLLEVCLLEVGKSFLHASAVSKGDSAMLISGTSHAGKTTLAVALIQEEGFKIMADDFPVVTNDGLCLPNPEPVNVEPSLEKLNDRIESWLSKQSLISLFHWRLRARVFGDKRTLRRIPLSLVGEYCDSTGRIGNIVHIERSDGRELVFDEISSRELGVILSRILGEELEPVPGLLDAYAEGNQPMLDINSLVRRAEEVYAMCFRDTRCTLVRIPEGADMRSVSRSIARRLH